MVTCAPHFITVVSTIINIITFVRGLYTIAIFAFKKLCSIECWVINFITIIPTIILVITPYINAYTVAIIAEKLVC